MTADTGILSRDLISAAGTATTKEEAIREAGGLLVAAGAVTDAYVEAMLERERSMSTFMGNGLAIPHGTNESKESIVRSALSLVRYENPIDWGAGQASVVVGIAGVGDEHLGILSKIAVVFSDADEAARIANATTSDEIYEVLESVNDD